MARVRQLLPDIREVAIGELTLLGSPLGENALEPSIAAYSAKVDLICSRIKELDAHWALFFLTRYVAAPRLNYVMRTSPLYQCSSSLQRIDEKVRTTTIECINVDLAGEKWSQASQPVRLGGLGIRSVEDLSLPAI